MALIAQYLFQNNANDNTGNGYNGTASNVTYETAPKNMNLKGGVAVFNGSNSVITLQKSLRDILVSNTWSFETWTKNAEGTLSGDRQMYVFKCGDGNSTDTIVGINYTPKGLRLSFYLDDLIFNDTSISNDKWHHLVVTYNRSTRLQQLFWDGAFAISRTSSGQPNPNGSSCKLGNAITGSYYFKGRLNNFRVYDEVLTAATVLQHYKAESTSPPNSSSRHVANDVAALIQSTTQLEGPRCH